MDIDENTEWEKVHKVAKEAKDTEIEKEKGRVYLKPGEKPPKGASMQRGARGGLYYIRREPQPGDYPEKKHPSYRFGPPTKPDWMPKAEWKARKKKIHQEWEEGPKKLSTKSKKRS